MAEHPVIDSHPKEKKISEENVSVCKNIYKFCGGKVLSSEFPLKPEQEAKEFETPALRYW